jgi:integrase
MPRLKRDKDGIFWRGGWAYLQHQGQRIALKTQDKETARELAREHKRRAEDPSFAAASVTSIVDACVKFREYAATGENRSKPPSPETFGMYETHFSHFVRIFGENCPLDQIDAAAVDDYIATRRAEPIGKKPEAGPDERRRVSARTVDKELVTLRQVLALGLRRGWYSYPLERVLPKGAGGAYVPIDRHLTLQQVWSLLAELGKSGLSDDPAGRVATCAYIVAFGADWCAVERAQRDDLGGSSACNLLVLIRGTKNATRWDDVPVIAPFQPLAELAREYLATHGSFPRWGKQRCRDLAAACRRAGVPRVTPRDLRRTHGQILAACGVPPHLIGRMLRHTDSRMAEKTYAVPERADVGRQVAGVTRTRHAAR